MRKLYFLLLILSTLFVGMEPSFGARGDRRGRDRSSSSRNRRGRGSSNTRRVARSVSTTQIEEELEETDIDAVESLPLAPSVVPKSVNFKTFSDRLTQKFNEARVASSDIGLGLTTYSMSGPECVQKYQECASQVSMCGSNFENCVNDTRFALEERTYFCFEKLESKCHPNTHEKMFEGLLAEVQAAQSRKLDSERPQCEEEIGLCVRQNCPGGEIDGCFEQGLESAQQKCASRINKCRGKYPDIWTQFEKNYWKLKEKYDDEKAIYTQACRRADGRVKDGICYREFDVRYIQNENFKALKRVKKMDIMSEKMSVALSDEQPIFLMCGNDTGALDEMNAIVARQKKRRTTSTIIGGVAGAATGAYFGAQFLPIGTGGGKALARTAKSSSSSDEESASSEERDRTPVPMIAARNLLQSTQPVAADTRDKTPVNQNNSRRATDLLRENSIPRSNEEIKSGDALIQERKARYLGQFQLLIATDKDAFPLGQQCVTEFDTETCVGLINEAQDAVDKGQNQ